MWFWSYWSSTAWTSGSIRSSFLGLCVAPMQHRSVKFNFPQKLWLFLGHLWHWIRLRTICWSNQSPQEYADCPFVTLEMVQVKFLAILSNGCPTLCLCNLSHNCDCGLSVTAKSHICKSNLPYPYRWAIKIVLEVWQLCCQTSRCAPKILSWMLCNISEMVALRTTTCRCSVWPISDPIFNTRWSMYSGSHWAHKIFSSLH